mgnify:CR=1 FL=1
MENHGNIIVESINGVCFTIILQSSDTANKSTEDFIKNLIIEEILANETDLV